MTVGGNADGARGSLGAVATKKRTSGPSGKHKNPQRLLSQEPAEWELQDAVAAAEGVTWAEWARRQLQRLARRTRPKVTP